MAVVTDDREYAAKLVEELARRKKARESFAAYLEYVDGRPLPRHIKYIADKLQEVADGIINRLMVSLPPGHGKSFSASQHFPAWYLSRFSSRQFIGAAHTQSLSDSFGLKVRNVIKSDEHRRVFPEVSISGDKSAASEWNIDGTSGGYLATAVGASVTGRRGDILLGDDLLSGIEQAESESQRRKLWEWFNADFSTRAKSGDTPIILIGTRWHLGDHFGKLDEDERAGTGDKWVRVILPAIAGENDQLGREPGEALWPEQFPIEYLEKRKRSQGMTSRMWASLYQQTPIVDDGGIMSREWFRIWKGPPPKMEFVVQSWDTALTANKSSAYSAQTTWGVFRDDGGIPNMILLSAWRGRVEYHALRQMAKRLASNYIDVNENMPAKKQAGSPDLILVEAKANGMQLINDLRRAGVMATPFNPDKKGDKIARVRLITHLIENGVVWVPGQPPLYEGARPWAEDFLEQCVQFPASDSRDWVDTMTQAFHRVIDSGWVHHSDDPNDEPEERESRGLYW